MYLAKNGLIGKIHLSSVMTIAEVEAEIRSVFKEPMRNCNDFSFQYLQPTGCGSRCLTIPSVSSSFNWTASQVAKLAANKNAIYIIAKQELLLSDSDVSVQYKWPCI